MQLQAVASKHGLSGEICNDISAAIAASHKAAAPNDLILITGSIFLVADALNYFYK